MKFKDAISPGVMRFICVSGGKSFLIVLVVVFAVAQLLRFVDVGGLSFLFDEKILQINKSGVAGKEPFYRIAQAASIFFALILPLIIYLSIVTRVDVEGLCKNSNIVGNIKGLLISVFFLTFLSVFMVVVFPAGDQKITAIVFYSEMVYLFFNSLFILCSVYAFFVSTVLLRLFFSTKIWVN